jgi:hypothetical protein
MLLHTNNMSLLHASQAPAVTELHLSFRSLSSISPSDDPCQRIAGANLICQPAAHSHRPALLLTAFIAFGRP